MVNANAMTREEKELLLKDICSRLPYGVWVECCGVIGKLDNIWLTHFYNGGNVVVDVNGNTDFFHDNDCFDITKIKLYLRPMSSMTEKEYEEFLNTQSMECGDGSHPKYEYTYKTFDWLNANSFDYRGLIKKGLALEAPDGMYNF